VTDNETGRVNAIFPGSSLHYCQLIEEPRYEDYNIKYLNKHNPYVLPSGLLVKTLVTANKFSVGHSWDLVMPSTAV
jgi:hypothetical protein